MTKKEIYSEWVAISNILHALNPEKHTQQIDYSYAVNTFNPAKYTKKQLEDMLEQANKALEMEQENLRKATPTALKAEATVLAMKIRFNEGVQEYQAFLLRNYRKEDVVKINNLVAAR